MYTDIRDELLELGQRLRGIDALSSMETAEISDRGLLSFCRRNEAILHDARRIVRNHGRATSTLTFRDRQPCSLSHQQEQLAGSGQLARALYYAVQSAIRAGNTEEAGNTGADLVMFGNAFRNGGCVLDACLAISCEGLAVDALRRIRQRLGAICGSEVVGLLEKCWKTREPFGQIWRRDEEWTKLLDSGNPDPDLDEFEMEGLSSTESDAIRDAVISFSKRSKSEKHSAAQRNDDRSLAQLRLLVTEVALSYFEHVHGHLPISLDELCPSVLSHPPLDPFTDRPLIYRRIKEQFVLYSVGDNGCDNGGLVVPLEVVVAGGGDLFLDAEDL